MSEALAAAVVHGARLVAAGAFTLAAIVALTHWGVRRGTIAAFGGWARFVRRWSDPVLKQLERRLVRAGANPQDAPVWLVGVTVVAGLVLIALVDWLMGFILTVDASMQAGLLVPMLVHSLFEVLLLAIMIRVIASWIALSPYSRFMRLIHVLTDWLIEPLRRVVPPFGIFDVSPLVAYVILYFAEQLVMRAFF